MTPCDAYTKRLECHSAAVLGSAEEMEVLEDRSSVSHM